MQLVQLWEETEFEKKYVSEFVTCISKFTYQCISWRLNDRYMYKCILEIVQKNPCTSRTFRIMNCLLNI